MPEGASPAVPGSLAAAARYAGHAAAAVLLAVVATVAFVRLFAFDGPAAAWRFVAGMKEEWWD